MDIRIIFNGDVHDGGDHGDHDGDGHGVHDGGGHDDRDDGHGDYDDGDHGVHGDGDDALLLCLRQFYITKKLLLLKTDLYVTYASSEDSYDKVSDQGTDTSFLLITKKDNS
ncbi:hypothetical protein CDAR_520351 [Caerostris darwini]|uniref:Uncharacterized protein n=1 Tax=Caerostris darwini TaxID=1538125 RepID=A0AAV4PC52_9ARAC|nr:hypothetical protein CDAR_520351 [Caerostris darwini]